MYIVQVTSSAESTAQYEDYLPIHPAMKNPRTRIQLRLRSDWGLEALTRKRSYLKMGDVYKLPLESLQVAGLYGLQYELQRDSLGLVRRFLRDRKDLEMQEDYKMQEVL